LLAYLLDKKGEGLFFGQLHPDAMVDKDDLNDYLFALHLLGITS